MRYPFIILPENGPEVQGTLKRSPGPHALAVDKIAHQEFLRKSLRSFPARVPRGLLFVFVALSNNFPGRTVHSSVHNNSKKFQIAISIYLNEIVRSFNYNKFFYVNDDEIFQQDLD